MKARNARGAAVVALAAVVAVPAASAQAAPYWPLDDAGWPMSVPGSAYNAREVARDTFVTPEEPAFWDPTQPRPRLLSPFGKRTKIVCLGSGVVDRCWQADPAGNPHMLGVLPSPLGSVIPDSPQGFYFQG